MILGLRGLLREHPIRPFDLDIRGDSELVIKQLKGQYKVRNPTLKIYYEICIGLLNQVKGVVTLTHIPREHNQVADELATEASEEERDVDDMMIFYPSLMSLQDLKVSGNRTLIPGTDEGAAGDTREILFDATTIVEIFGKKALHNLRDPGRSTILKGKVSMTAVGILNLPVKCVLDLRGPIDLTLKDIVVVDSLPYDAQISTKNPIIIQAREEQRGRSGSQMTPHEFDASSVKNRFREHPYWTENTNFIPFF